MASKSAKADKLIRAAWVLAAGLLCAIPAAAADRVGGVDPSLAEPTPIKTEILIPNAGLAALTKIDHDGTVTDLAQYLGSIYNFLIASAGMVAAVMMVVGGFQYLTSAGDSSKIGAAKTRIFNALTGLLLALGAYTILNTINPATLKLEVPKGVSAVRTELSFLPFCDELAAQYQVGVDRIVRATNHKYDDCGDAGFLLTKIRNSDGTFKDNRLWCMFRGSKELAAFKREHGNQYTNDYGCDDDNSIAGERVIGDDLNVHTLSVCLPYNNISTDKLNELYDKDGVIKTDLGRCQACNSFTEGGMSRIGYPTGDLGCQLWQNTANNGTPKNYNFSLSKKGFFWDTRSPGDDDRSKRMYYCGWSESYKRCIYAPIRCHRVSECDDYDDMYLHYCVDKERAVIECHASQTLGSSWGTQTGNAAHLIPVCSSDPCDSHEKGCSVGGLAGTRNVAGIGRYTGGHIRMGARILSGGLLGSISCDAK